jgi:hypothetical protein
MLRGVFNGFKWGARRLVMRSRWVARRIWVITLADVALTARRHWRRLDENEQDRLVTLVRRSRGRRSRLSAKEVAELDQLLGKLGHWELAGTAVRKSLPFGGGLVARLLPKGREAGATEPQPERGGARKGRERERVGA